MTDIRVTEPRVPRTPDEVDLLARLRAGDERAFEMLVEQHHSTMITVARMYVKTHATAEEVVQDAWLSVLRSLDGFEGRSSLKTWIMRIGSRGRTTDSPGTGTVTRATGGHCRRTW